jgi:predicted nucleotidyltransferase
MPDASRWGLSEEDISRIRSVFRRNSRIRQVILFGSRAKGTFRRGSDIDLALLGEGLSREDELDASLALNEETPLPYRFDVVDRAHLESRELAEHIDRVGQELYTQD